MSDPQASGLWFPEAPPEHPSWREVWQRGFVPHLSDAALWAMRLALLVDDPALIQGGTSSPVPSDTDPEPDCCAACLLGIGVWRGDGLQTVAEVESRFAELCAAVDAEFGEVAACRWWLNPADEWPRPEFLANMLGEVEAALTQRRAARQLA